MISKGRPIFLRRAHSSRSEPSMSGASLCTGMTTEISGTMDQLRRLLAFEDGVLHRVVLPASVAADADDAGVAEEVEHRLARRLVVIVEEHVRGGEHVR